MKIAILIATNTCSKETSHTIIDSGASCCVTPYIEDFIHQPTPIQNTTLKGIAGGLTALGRVTVQLKIHQENKDNIIVVIDNVIYAPDCPIRLISPQQLHRQSKAKGHGNSCVTTEETTSTLYHGGDTFTCAYHPKTKIPTLNCITDSKTQKIQIAAPLTFTHQPSNKGCKHVIFHNDKPPCSTAAYNSNLNTSQQELLRLHETYAHADMLEIQQQIKNCDIKAPRQVATCQIPKCLSCSENKGKKQSHKQHCGSITQDYHHPGSNTSIDHFDAANVPGYTWQHKGQPTLKKYKNFMLFVDHKTLLVYPLFQESKTASEACQSKCDYKTFAKRYNVTIDSYHDDNGAFRYEAFQKSIDNNNQKLNFSGVNGQWQNGLVECSNGTLCAAARSMLNHAISRWDKTITAELWPFEIQHAATIYNTTRRRSRDYDLSLWEKCTGKRSKLNQTDMHPLLCPVYVLDRRIQEGASPPKWTKRTTQKVYVGHLHHYSKSVPMIWDPKTKLVSPQFQVMFDDNFDTVQAPDPNIKQSDTMDRLLQTNRYMYDGPFGNEHTYLLTSG
jgi:hypothetical protein